MTFNLLGDEGRVKLLHAVDDAGISMFVEAFWPDVDDARRARLLAEQGKNLVISQEEYGKCQEVTGPREQTLFDTLAAEPTTVVGQFCKNVSQALGDANDPTLRAVGLQLFRPVILNENILSLARLLD